MAVIEFLLPGFHFLQEVVFGSRVSFVLKGWQCSLSAGSQFEHVIEIGSSEFNIVKII